MALVLPADLQLWLRWRAERSGCSIEQALLDALYEVQHRDQQVEITRLQASSGDVWASVEQEATAKAAWRTRHPGGPASSPPT